MRFLVCIVAVAIFCNGSMASAKQFQCSHSDETGTVTMSFDSSKPLFKINVRLADGNTSEEKLLSPLEACHIETVGLRCRSSERSQAGQYSYSFECGASVHLNVYLDEF